MELCAFRLRESCVVFAGLLVGFWCPANTLLRMGVLEAQDGVVSVFWSDLAFDNIDEHFQH